MTIIFRNNLYKNLQHILQICHIIILLLADKIISLSTNLVLSGISTYALIP